MTTKLPRATRLPRFNDQEEEAAFYDTHDLSELPGKEVQLKAVSPLKHLYQLEIDKALLRALTAHARARNDRIDDLLRRWITEALAREPTPSAASATRKRPRSA
jgi:hypothetical protein